MLVAAAGTAAGTALALGASRLLGKLLFEVGAGDPTVFAAVAATLLAVALVACWAPARRATRVDPALALRHG